MKNIPVNFNLDFNVALHDEGSQMAYKYLNPTKVLWKLAAVDTERLLDNSVPTQASFDNTRVKCVVNNGGAVLLDFGIEIHGFVQIIIKDVRGNGVIRVRFGESASEAMAEEACKNAGNDHIRRDFTYKAGFLSMPLFGPTGFRFARIDVVDAEFIVIDSVRAILVCRDLPYVGSFESSDEEINRIWRTSAYTVQLNMQEYIWDGIKRDRLVWLGDMHPEISTIAAVFGNVDVVNKSLDFMRDCTPPNEFMNGIPAYSMWWIIIHYTWLMNFGDIKYLRENLGYMRTLADELSKYVDKNGRECFNNKFIDWPSQNPEFNTAAAQHEGMQALTAIMFDCANRIFTRTGDDDSARKYQDIAELMRKYRLENGLSGYKQSAALAGLAGIVPMDDALHMIQKGGAKGLSTFLGYYTLELQARASDMSGALYNIRNYWGKMLEYGATTFWEDFNIEWLENAGRIDELVPDGKKDLHGDFGDYCYKGFRHSLCHGWSSGPAAFLSGNVLGVHPIKEGFEDYIIKPDLGDLEWVRGTYPTKDGYFKIYHTKRNDGTVYSEVDRIYY